MLPNGYEEWYVKNFKSGPGLSEWYRGITVPDDYFYTGFNNGDKTIAKLNILGLSNSMINKLHYEYYLFQHSKKVQWLDFAERIVRAGRNLIFPGKSLKTNFEFTEIQTDRMISVQATFRLLCDPANASLGDSDYELCRYCMEDSFCIQSSVCKMDSHNMKSFNTLKRYEGVSTRTRKKRRPKNEKEIMEKEAKKAALMEFFKDRFGFTEFKDIFVDDLFRPV